MLQDEGQAPAPGQGYLSGNFAPVGREVFATDLPVEGTLPAALDGVYIRNGPNPQFPPDTPAKYHWCASLAQAGAASALIATLLPLLQESISTPSARLLPCASRGLHAGMRTTSQSPVRHTVS